MSRQKPRMASDGASDASLAEKKKARHRLVGAIVLCLIAALVVPMLLESEPRNAERDLPLGMALSGSRAADGSLQPPAGPEDDHWDEGQPDRLVMLEERVVGLPPGQFRSSQRAAAPASGSQDAPSSAETAAAAGQSAPAVPRTPEPPAPAERPDVLARLIEQVNKPGSQPARPPERRHRRFLVQVGAYSSVKSARLASDRIAKVGMTAYHETVKTANGEWIRVRIGPFESREDAERAQQVLKRAGVTAALIAL